MSISAAPAVKCGGTDEEHWNQTGDVGCDCPSAPDDTDEERNAKAKAYGIEFIPVDDEWLRLQRLKRHIRQRNAYLKTLPVPTDAEVEQDRIDSERIIAEWDAEVNKAFHEAASRPLGIGEWNHDEPCTVPDNHIKGFTEAMEFLGVKFRYNVRSVSAEIYHESFGAWRGMDDRLGAELREKVAERFVYVKKKKVLPIQASDQKMAEEVAGGKEYTVEELNDLGFRMSLVHRTTVTKERLRYGREAWNDTLNAYLYHHECDPFKDVLEALPRHDGVERVKGWLQKVFTIADPNGLVEWASIFIFLATVTRTFAPGTKLDEMPVLIGRGGIGKSTALRYILPPDMPSLFSDSLNLAGTPQERAESMQGRAIVEASELAGVSKADIASLKTFLSRTDDGNVRLAYRRNPELMLRRAIIVGTSDLQSPLPNDRNLRRWAPIYLTDGDPTKLRKYLDENRDQLWAEALSMYRDGKEARLPDKLIEAQVKATAKARSRDVVLEDAVEEFLALRTEPFTMQFLAESIKLVDIKKGASVPMGDQFRLSAVLDGKGYSKRQVREDDGAKRWQWHMWEQSNKEILND